MISGSDSDKLGRIVRVSAQDGLSLATRRFGVARDDRLPLFCLPGLSRNSLDFLGVGQRFGVGGPDGRQVIALDYRGRGLSDADPNWRNYTPLTEAYDVLATTTALGIEKAILLGTSRGGIISMLLGALRPGLLAGIILNDIGPVVEGTGLARIKTYLTASRPVRSWDEALSAVRRTAGNQFTSLDAEDWRAWAEAVFVPGRKGLEPSFDRRLLKTLQSIDFTDAVPVLWPQFDSLAGRPLLAIRGENSDLLSERTLSAMAQRNPNLEIHVVPDQGHAPLLRDKPTLDRIAAFCSRCDALADIRPDKEGAVVSPLSVSGMDDWQAGTGS